MESNRSASRQHRSANSCPGGKIALQFVNVRPEDRNSKKQTQAIVRANAAYYHWRHNRPPRDKTKFKLPGRSTVSGHDKRRPTSNIQPGPNANPPLTYNYAFHRSLINYCIAFSRRLTPIKVPQLTVPRRRSYSSRSISWRKQPQCRSKPDTDVNIEPLRVAYVYYGSSGEFAAWKSWRYAF